MLILSLNVKLAAIKPPASELLGLGFFFHFSSHQERNNCICTYSGKRGYLQKVQGKSKKLERKGQPWAEASTFTTVMLVNSWDQTLLLSLKPPAYLWPWPPRSAHCLCKGFPRSEPGCGHALGHVREGTQRHPWGKCPSCLGMELTPRGVHPWAAGIGLEGETWTFHPEGKEEGNRENICKPMAAVTNMCSNNMGLNGNGWRQTDHLLLRKAHYKINWKADGQRDESLESKWLVSLELYKVFLLYQESHRVFICW